MKIKILLPLLMFLVLGQPGQAQSKWDKSLAKVEVLYNSGAYSGASKALAKFKKKVDGKMGAQNMYTPTIFFLQAKYDLASGLPMEFETNLQNALNANRPARRVPSHGRGLRANGRLP